jgi:hypothetical protein
MVKPIQLAKRESRSEPDHPSRLRVRAGGFRGGAESAQERMAAGNIPAPAVERTQRAVCVTSAVVAAMGRREGE